VFEFGNLRTLEGEFHHQPVPHIIVDKGFFPDSITTNDIVLLIGFGKFGAEETIAQIEQEHNSIEGKRIQLSGTLIYGDGKTLFELTEGKQSLVKIKGEGNKEIITKKNTKQQKIRGQILDPKCYFGVMKHGEGKVHRSCAIRCISGGIPPILRMIMEDGETYYYILRGENGEAINKEILDFVADPIEVTAKEEHLFYWGNVLYINPKEIKRLKKAEYTTNFIETY